MRMGMEEAVLAHVRPFFEWLWAHLVKGVGAGGGGCRLEVHRVLVKPPHSNKLVITVPKVLPSIHLLVT